MSLKGFPLEVRSKDSKTIEYTIAEDFDYASSDYYFKVIYPDAKLFKDKSLIEIMQMACDDASIITKSHISIILDEKIFENMQVHVDDNTLTVKGISYNEEDVDDDYKDE